MSTVTSSSSSPSDTSNDDTRVGNGKILCTTQGCNQTFNSAGELAVHKQKHQMTLKLGPARTGLTDMLPFDQTPTPTKFLQYGKESGLFEEISNPFDSEFKRTASSMREQPVHVITLTPTLPSPIIPGSQFFLPPLPSPQGFSTATLISPSIVPFSAPGLYPSVQAVVEAQHAALAQAFINAASASTATMTSINSQSESMALPSQSHILTSQSHMAASRTSSITDLPSSVAPPFPTQNVSVPVNNNPTPPTCRSMPVSQNMPSAPVGSASVIQQHVQANMEQRRPLSQSDSLDHPNLPNSANLERKPTFHGETSVITQVPAHSSTGQINVNMGMHTANANGYPYMSAQQSLPPFSHLTEEMSGRMANHQILTSSRSVPTPTHMQNQRQLPHQNSLGSIDAKQKLKETLTSNNPNLHVDLASQYSLDSDENDLNEVTSSSGMDDGQKTGRRRGRQNNIDPDTKRMRFLERNRAAASRCRAKKKQWVNGLESKAKELSNSNVSLQGEVAQLREEVASLKQLLLAHRDCPITRLQQQKLAIAGGDPSAVVTNPVQAAASLLGIERGENAGAQNGDEDDVKPGLASSNMDMRISSSLHNSNRACKTEHPLDDFPQVTSTSAITMNSNYGSNPNLSTIAGT